MKAACQAFIAIIILHGAELALCAEEAATMFSGSCRNVTHGLDGLLKLYVVENSDGTLDGYMSISGWLVGSGDLKGAKNGQSYKFKTKDSLWGMEIEWQGSRQGDKVSGEYFIAPNASLGTDRQVGEWDVELQDEQKSAAAVTERSFQHLFMLHVEAELNAPVRLEDGSSATGAGALFDSVHPAGDGVSLCVTNVDIEWKGGASRLSADEIRRYTVDYVLFWHGVLQPTGHTQLRLKYNVALKEVTAHEVLESTGTTRAEVGDLAFAIGFILGKSAVESMLSTE